jgi:hypothetical protein
MYLDFYTDCWAIGGVLYEILCEKSIRTLVCDACDLSTEEDNFTTASHELLNNREVRSRFKEIILKDLNGAGVEPLMQLAIVELLNPDRDVARGIDKILRMIEEKGKEKEHQTEYEAAGN